MIEHVEVQVLILLLIASFVGMGARRLRLPYTLALVVAGLVLGFLHLEALEDLELNHDLLLLLFLPALLFEAAFHLDLSDFRKNIVPILTMAVPGVLVAVSATAGLAWVGLGLTGLVPGFTVSHALLFASVIAATDPISVLALFKELGVTKRLYLLVEGESLLNDGVAVVVFAIVAAVLGFSGHGGHAPELHTTMEIASFGLRTFLWMAGGGVLIGLMCGGAVAALTRQIDDHLIEVTLTTLVAFGSFLLAEQIHASGVLSTVAAGIVMGSYGRTYGMSVSTRVAVEDHWEYMAFLANSFIFLLVGLELDVFQMGRLAPAILIGFVAVTAARALVVYSAVPLTARWVEPIPWSWRHVLVWGGLRGSLSMVLIITIPATFEGRGTLVDLVFGVVAVSLFLQGLTMPPLMKVLGLLRGGSGDRTAYELARGRALAARSALESLEDMEKHGVLSKASYRRLREWYEARMGRYNQEAKTLSGADWTQDELMEGLRELADVERDTFRHALHTGVLSPEAVTSLSMEVDERMTTLREAQHHGDEAVGEAIERLLPPGPQEAGSAAGK